MDNTSEKVEIKLLWEKLKDNISEKENLILEEWLKASPNNKTFFDKLSEYYKTGSIPEQRENMTREAWIKLQSTIYIHKKKARQKQLVAIFGIAATILLFIGIFSITRYPSSEPVDELSHIYHGSSKAVLILSNGETIKLDENGSFSKKMDGANIKSNKTQISYHFDKQTGIIKYNTLKIPRGAEYLVILSDSTRVWLNSETSLKYPVVFESGSRIVEISGEAYFEVTPDKERPFIVKTEDQMVEVLGTSFNINSYGEYESIQTTLVEGHIKVYLDNKTEQSVILDPGQQVTYLPGEGQFKVRNVNIEEYVSWKDGFFQFREKSLKEMMVTIGRWYDINVDFADSSKAKIKFTGVIKRYEEFDKILELLQKTEEVKFEIDNKDVTVK